MTDGLDVNIEIDLAEMGRSLAMNPDFVRLATESIRLQLTKDVRSFGNALGHWAQKPAFTNTDSNRLK